MMNKKKKIILFTFLILVTFGVYIAKNYLNNSTDEFVYYGTCEADKINIASETSGRISDIKKNEGDKVSSGDLVVALGNDEAKKDILSYNDGVIQTINFKKGEVVAAGSPIVTLLDLNNLWVKIYVPEKALSDIKLGNEVTLKSDFIKDKTLKGKIVYISPESEFTPLSIVTKKDRMKLVYAVKIRITENLELVKPGMLFDVKVK